MSRRRQLIPALALLLVAGAPPQGASDHGAIVIIVGGEPATPIPTLLGAKANNDVSDLLFLRLARPSAALTLTDEKSYEPQLARSWTRRDSLTIAFDLDPRAKWSDGIPVTANDIVWSFQRERDPAVDPARALLLRYLATVTAETPQRVVLTFRRAYAEQFFDAVFHVQPLPAHLVDTIPPARFAGSAFVQHPVGNGPYRWVRREPGRQLELAANPDFFLGAPKLDRVVFVLARDPDAQMNLLLDGTGDVLEALPPVSGPPRLASRPEVRMFVRPSFGVQFLLFNERAYGDRSRPHPILADPDVRKAIALAIDRPTMVRSAYNTYGVLADAPVAQAHWTRGLVPKWPVYDRAAARALLEKKGWVDRDGDGVREKDGVPLQLRLNVIASSFTRVTMAPQIQEQLRQIGVKLDIVRLEGGTWADRRGKGEFDIDFSGSVYDPSPTGIVQSWTCAGRAGTNVAQYCNPSVDSLIDRAIFSTKDTERRWTDAYTALQRDVPAAFIVSPNTVFAIHSRFRGVTVRPESFYVTLWQWSVDPSRRIARDGATGR